MDPPKLPWLLRPCSYASVLIHSDTQFVNFGIESNPVFLCQILLQASATVRQTILRNNIAN